MIRSVRQVHNDGDVRRIVDRIIYDGYRITKEAQVRALGHLVVVGIPDDLVSAELAI